MDDTVVFNGKIENANMFHPEVDYTPRSDGASTPELQPTSQEQFHTMVRNQKNDLIMQRLDNFWAMSPTTRSRQSKLFVEIFTTICQKYFIEDFGNMFEDEIDNILNGTQQGSVDIRT